MARGSLKVDGDDIAGVGIIVAFFLPSIISLLISFILILPSLSSRGKGKKGGLKGIVPRLGHGGFPERAYNSLESILRAISDIQILLALSLAMSVVVFGICRTIQYHFEIGINLLLLACANYLQTLGLTRHYWRSWPAALAAFIRLLAVIGIYFCFGWILAIQNSSPDTLRKHQFVAERMPGDNKTDSVVFLKAACFLDPYFQNNTFVPLEPAERTSIGLHENNGRAPEWLLGIMLVLLTGIAFITCLVQVFRGPPKTTKRMTVLRLVYRCSIWLLSLAVLCYCAATVFGLRSWVSKSGWLQPVEKGNPDDSVRGFGQTAALVLLAAMVIAALENASVTVKGVKPKKASKGKYRKVKRHV
ncbi:MAG: hypothetical protein LQ346_001187 [Caloplaca aetnensis]|nr:MAG: hypothetical protein LQ346_001187 [Caloplaca aetnensis]